MSDGSRVASPASSSPSVLLISKPVVPPWHDSGKNLVRDLAAAGARYTYHVLAVRGALPPGPHAVVEPVYGAAGAYSPGLKQNARVLLRLLRPDSQAICHFFFAPNPMSSRMARLALALKPRRSVHTLCSAPRTFAAVRKLLFADRVITLSRHTLCNLEAQGVTNAVHIPPCVPLSPPVEPERKARVRKTLGLPDRPLVLFPGDYQFSNAAAVCLNALEQILSQTDAHFVFACRVKQAESRALEAGCKARVEAMRLTPRVTFANEVDDMEALVASAALTVLPADSLFAKMDIPLVLLESLRERVPVVVSDYGPLPELAADGGAVVTPAGDCAAFGRTVVDLLAAAEPRDAMGAAGRRMVERTYNPAAMAAAYERVYDALLGNPESEIGDT